MSQKNSNVSIRIPKILQKQLNNKKIGKIYKNFEKNLNLDKNFAVAVSGGPDSLALAVLAKIYAVKKKLVSKFFIIDHQIRKASYQEAKLTRRKLSSIGINSQILIWKGKKPTKNLQSLARKKRYELLIANCNKFKIKNILLGHHEGDVIENFFIRILRGSGLKGLISLSMKTKLQNITILRPLINQKKEDLVFISKKVFDFYVKDPSNDDENNEMGDFNPPGAPESSGVERTTDVKESPVSKYLRDGPENKTGGHTNHAVEYRDTSLDMNAYQENYGSDASNEEYYKKFVPNYPNYPQPDASSINKPYYDSYHISSNQNQVVDNNLLIEKLNYMIHLLEEQQDERLGSVTEEVILYSFLGIFVIFIADSFTRIGKYKR